MSLVLLCLKDNPNVTTCWRWASGVELKFRISLFDHRGDNLPKPAERTLPQICRRVERPTVRTEKDGALWSPATFSPLRRENENVTELSLVVLEFDHNTSRDEIVSCMKPLDIAFIVHSTHSHRRVTEKNPEAEARYRLLIPLAKPVPAAKFHPLRSWLVERTNNKADKAASALAQMFYTPVKACDDAEYEYHIEEGPFLDWSKLDQAPPPPPRLKTSHKGNKRPCVAHSSITRGVTTNFPKGS